MAHLRSVRSARGMLRTPASRIPVRVKLLLNALTNDQCRRGRGGGKPVQITKAPAGEPENIYFTGARTRSRRPCQRFSFPVSSYACRRLAVL